MLMNFQNSFTADRRISLGNSAFHYRFKHTTKMTLHYLVKLPLNDYDTSHSSVLYQSISG